MMDPEPIPGILGETWEYIKEMTDSNPSLGLDWELWICEEETLHAVPLCSSYSWSLKILIYLNFGWSTLYQLEAHEEQKKKKKENYRPTLYKSCQALLCVILF